MTARIPVYLKHTNTSTNTDDLLLPVTTADQIEESSDKQFISQAEKATLSNKQDNLGYTPVNKAGDTLNGPLILSSDAITDARQAVTKSYVDLKASKKEAVDIKINKIPKKKLKFNNSNRRFGNDITNSIKNNAQYNGFRSFHKKCSSVANKVSYKHKLIS